MSASRVETVVTNLMSEFASITVANGYRNDLSQSIVYGLRPIEKMTKDIEVGIQPGDESIRTENGNSYDASMDIYVHALVKVGIDDPSAISLVESISHDIKRCTAKVFRKYIMYEAPWTVDPTRGIDSGHDVLSGQGKSVHRVGVRFSVFMRAMSEDMV